VDSWNSMNPDLVVWIHKLDTGRHPSSVHAVMEASSVLRRLANLVVVKKSSSAFIGSLSERMHVRKVQTVLADVEDGQKTSKRVRPAP
jgi:hypothetical protein